MKINLLLLTISTAVLTACGGGGEGTTTEFALAAAYGANLPTSKATSFDITGTCVGTGTRFVTAPEPGSFEGAPALVKTITATSNFTNCPNSGTVTSYDYYDANLDVLGFLTPNVAYSKFLARVVVPELVKVGDGGVLGTALTFTDSSKSRQIGTTTYSYQVESRDGPSAVTAKLISTNVDANGGPFSVQTETYRLTATGSATGTLKLLVDDVQYANGFRITLTVR
ncbi:MAG: hypothetical protein H7242_12935 [Microbacteriaceae bacterium]|nr:hypothetical protein [Burkholderiaceae bacterium]